jgi:hypothetical protein
MTAVLDAVVVGAPGYDGLLDLFGVEVFGDGAGGKCGDFGVGGEAQGDELIEGELVDDAELTFGQQVGEAELFFEADDAVLVLEGVATRLAGKDKEKDRHGYPPEMVMVIGRPGVPGADGRVDGEREVEEQHRDEEEVEEWVEARVVFEVLRLGHRAPS